MSLLEFVVVGSVGLITGVVTWRVLREHDCFGKISLPIAVCGALLAAIGVMSTGANLVLLCIPWSALGLTVLVALIVAALMGLFARGTGDFRGKRETDIARSKPRRQLRRDDKPRGAAPRDSQWRPKDTSLNSEERRRRSDRPLR